MPEAVTLKQRIDNDRTLAKLTSQVAQNPHDTATKQKLADTVAQAASLKIANPAFLAHVASPHNLLGDRAKALEVADTALKIDPNQAEAKQVKNAVTGAAAHN